MSTDYCCEYFQAVHESEHIRKGSSGWWYMILHGDYDKNSIPDTWPISHCAWCGAKLK